MATDWMRRELAAIRERARTDGWPRGDSGCVLASADVLTLLEYIYELEQRLAGPPWTDTETQAGGPTLDVQNHIGN